jgi:hypothetical protein
LNGIEIRGKRSSGRRVLWKGGLKEYRGMRVLKIKGFKK